MAGTLTTLEIIPRHLNLCLKKAMDLASKRSLQALGVKYLGKQKDICRKREGEENDSIINCQGYKRCDCG